MTDRGRRKVRTGTVVSDKMTKTVTVSMVRRFAHSFYGKQITRTKTVAAHDEQLFGRVLSFRDDHTRQGVGEKSLNRRTARLRIEGREVGNLGLAQDMNAVGADETRRVPREHEAGARRLRRADLAVEADFRRQQLELQRIAFAGEQVADF